MTLPKKPPLKPNRSDANREKRSDRCRVCQRTDRKIELAHVIGIASDTREAVVTTVEGREVRVCRINPDRVVPLCGPQQQPGTCHYGLDLGHDLELWDFLTPVEKQQAIHDAGSLGQAMRRCAPRTRGDRVEIVNGEQREVFRGSCV